MVLLGHEAATGQPPGSRTARSRTAGGGRRTNEEALPPRRRHPRLTSGARQRHGSSSRTHEAALPQRRLHPTLARHSLGTRSAPARHSLGTRSALARHSLGTRSAWGVSCATLLRADGTARRQRYNMGTGKAWI